ncbi:MAG: hypothetical protein JKY32_00720 [Rhizobiales bacterium]|nr:hypothetical protein [Hyphomicrobiales bacterium]
MGAKFLFWFAVSVTGSLYGAMAVWSLPTIISEANGLWPFDLRPTGYSFDEAREFLAALSDKGSDFYLNVQQRLDKYFPFFLALTTGWAIFLLTPNMERRRRLLLTIIPIPGMIFDYMENTHVAGLLIAGQNGITSQMVELASFYSRLKSGYVTLAFIVLLILGIKWVMQRRRAANSV